MTPSIAEQMQAEIDRLEDALARARGLLEEARKWLVNFPGPEYRSNIECWQIGVGTFLERLAGDAPPAPVCTQCFDRGRIWSIDFQEYVPCPAKVCPARPAPLPRFRVAWENTEGTVVRSPGTFERDEANTHASAMGGWVEDAARPAPAPACECRWPEAQAMLSKVQGANTTANIGHAPDCPARVP